MSDAAKREEEGKWCKKGDVVSRNCKHSVEEGLYACTPCIDIALSARDQVIVRLAKACKEIEWSAYDETSGGGNSGCLCPECGELKEEGHNPDCAFGLALSDPLVRKLMEEIKG